jgi:hypothetical protein
MPWSLCRGASRLQDRPLLGCGQQRMDDAHAEPSSPALTSSMIGQTPDVGMVIGGRHPSYTSLRESFGTAAARPPPNRRLPGTERGVAEAKLGHRR